MLSSLCSREPQSPISADVAVVGAGLAGLVLANKLVGSGLRVVVLESGAEKQNDELHSQNKVELSADRYQGATGGRVRALGGTSTRWGGALLPYLGGDFKRHPCDWHEGWGFDANELTPFLACIESDFGVEGGGYEGEEEVSALLKSFHSRLPKWPSFQNRATSNIYQKVIQNNMRLDIWTDAMVTEIRLNTDRIVGVVAQNANGNKLVVNSTQVAITAGAIETTRLLLLLNLANNGRIFPAGSPLGQGFHDHLSAPIANLHSQEISGLSRLFSFRFVPGGMRNLRFELNESVRAERKLPAAFLHVSFSRASNNGFEGLRRIYQAMQRRESPRFCDFSAVLADMPWFFRAVWWRFVENRVLPPSEAGFELHLVTEQKPDSSNRISLSDTARDQFGLPLVNIEWRVGEEDKLLFLQIAELAISDWLSGPLASLAEPKIRDMKIVATELVEGGGIYHPAGSTRIGPDATRGVVDSQLRVHGVAGLWAISTSVFPSVGGTSPSLGLMQFALRAADDIASSIHRDD